MVGVLSLYADSAYLFVSAFAWHFFTKLESVEQISKYLGAQSEGAMVTHGRPPSGWPQYGIITFEGSSLVSDAGSYQLHNVWCCIRAQEKVSLSQKQKENC